MHAAIDHLAWPFFDDAHRALATSVTKWTTAQGTEPVAHTEAEVDELVKQAKRDVLLAHLRNTDVQVEKKDNTAWLGVR